MAEVIFLDKDSTLGEWYDLPSSQGLYPNVGLFLEAQQQKGRQLYVATSAGENGRVHLADIADKLDGYFGSEKLNTAANNFYVLSDGQIRRVDGDYNRRINFESEARKRELKLESYGRGDRLWRLAQGSPEREALQNKINAFFDYWYQLLHNDTREPFDESARYQNPNKNPNISHGSAFMKDLFLARRLVDPVGYNLFSYRS